MDLIPEELRIPREGLEPIQFLKAGGCGAVFKGSWTRKGEKEFVAIKMVKAHGKGVIEDICRELQTMASFNCENICKVYGACMNNNSELWLILKYADGGNFHDYLKTAWPLPLSEQYSFAIQAAKSLEHLHTAQCLHRDVKSLNFLVHNNSKLMLTDFGFSTTKVNIKDGTGGTLRWAAPEVLVEPPQPPLWSEKADIYSLGMFFYEIVSGKVPFHEDEGRAVLFSKITSGVRPNIPAACSKEMANMIRRCWETEPHKRPTASELVIELGCLQGLNV